MPWHIEHRGNKWCAIKDSDGSNAGCSDTEEEAKAHLRALYASESFQYTEGKMSLAPNIQKLLNAEVTRERYAVAVYSSLSSWADSQGFEGLSKWADKSSAEEATHAQKFIDYLRDRATVQLEAVKAPPSDFASYGEALGAALTLERTVTAAITEIFTAARDAGDGATLSLSEWFLTEQVKSERELEIYIMRVNRTSAIDLLDLELFED